MFLPGKTQNKLLRYVDLDFVGEECIVRVNGVAVLRLKDDHIYTMAHASEQLTGLKTKPGGRVHVLDD